MLNYPRQPDNPEDGTEKNMKLLPHLTLRRKSGGWVCVSTAGVWFETDTQPLVEVLPSAVAPLRDTPELRALVAYGLGFECLGWFETVVAVKNGQRAHLGTRPCAYDPRGFAEESVRRLEVDRPFTVTAGHREKMLPPGKYEFRQWVLCGRMNTGEVPEGFSR